MITTKQVIFRLIISMALSSVIGIDRESTKKPAGLRTHVLVSLGATLIMLLSLYDPTMEYGPDFVPSDRLAAQVISGIGFLGAGTILRSGSGLVTGLTTAASLWVVAAIGLSVGAGFYSGAVVATVLVFIILGYFQTLEPKVLVKPTKSYSVSILVDDRPGQIYEIDQVFNYYRIDVLETSIKNIGDKKEITKKINLPQIDNKYNFLSNISNIEGVIEISDITKEE